MTELIKKEEVLRVIIVGNAFTPRRFWNYLPFTGTDAEAVKLEYPLHTLSDTERERLVIFQEGNDVDLPCLGDLLDVYVNEQPGDKK